MDSGLCLLDCVRALLREPELPAPGALWSIVGLEESAGHLAALWLFVVRTDPICSLARESFPSGTRKIAVFDSDPTFCWCFLFRLQSDDLHPGAPVNFWKRNGTCHSKGRTAGFDYR